MFGSNHDGEYVYAVNELRGLFFEYVFRDVVRRELSAYLSSLFLTWNNPRWNLSVNDNLLEIFHACSIVADTFCHSFVGIVSEIPMVFRQIVEPELIVIESQDSVEHEDALKEGVDIAPLPSFESNVKH